MDYWELEPGTQMNLRHGWLSLMCTDSGPACWTRWVRMPTLCLSVWAGKSHHSHSERTQCLKSSEHPPVWKKYIPRKSESQYLLHRSRHMENIGGYSSGLASLATDNTQCGYFEWRCKNIIASTAYWNSSHNAGTQSILDLVCRYQSPSTGTRNVVHRNLGQLGSTSTRPI